MSLWIPARDAEVRLDRGGRRRHSYTRVSMADGFGVLGFVTLLCGVMGLGDDRADALILIGLGLPGVVVGLTVRKVLRLHPRPSPSQVLTGLGLTWMLMVLLGTAVYLLTDVTDAVDVAFTEAAAGFATTNFTSVEVTEMSVAMQLWRAATQWVGGILGLLAGVVALPRALKGSSLAPGDAPSAAERLVSSPTVGRQRVMRIYVALTLLVGLGYFATGMGRTDSVVHAFTTVSTGGFSNHADSFSSFGTATRVIATIAMALAGTSYFVIWWMIRGRASSIWRSGELRLYVAILVVVTAAVYFGTDDISVADSAFTAASSASTTGLAVIDWTVLDSSVLAVLMITIGTGSMAASAGAGLRVLRARTLVSYAIRELRRQLDPSSVVVLKHGGVAVDERAIERATGYQIAHLALCFVAGFVLALGGLGVSEALYSGVSIVSTHGAAPGLGPFGDASVLTAPTRLAMVPFMLAGRLSILPLLLALSAALRGRRNISRRVRRYVTGRKR